MKVIVADALGPSENYHIRQMPLPKISNGQVRVKVCAAAVGYVDALISRGDYQIKPPVPYIPGSEFAGIVDAVDAVDAVDGVDTVDSDESNVKVGDRVCGYSFGQTLAEYVVVDAAALSVLPDKLSFAAGASFLVNYRTGLHALMQRGNLKRSETLLVLGAAGGVGISAVQLGKVMGAKVIAGASTDAKRQFALDNGADEVLDYSVDNWRATLKELTSGHGVDVVFDPVGGKLLEPAFRSLAWGGRYLVIGFAGGVISKLPTNLPLLKGAAMIGVDILQFGNREPQMAAENTRLLWEWVVDDKIKPPLGPLYPFDEFRTALSKAILGESLGKIVLQINDT